MKVDSVMIDIETMGLGPNAAVIQIGAVGFNLVTGEVDKTGYLEDVSLMSAVENGGEVHKEVVEWWQTRGGFVAFRRPELGGAVHVEEALGGLRNYLCDLNWSIDTDDRGPRVWAQGPSFDVAVLEGYARRLGVPELWAYNKPRDTRTIKDLARTLGWEPPELGEPTHQAKEDCLLQIDVLISAWGHIHHRATEIHPSPYPLQPVLIG